LARILALFIAVPFIELILLIEIGKRIGTANTLLLIVLTGIVGGLMARSQGLTILGRIRDDLARGEVPAVGLVDGLLVLVGGALLLTPGLITDAVGFSFLLPPVRQVIKAWARKKLEAMVERGSVVIFRR